MTPPGIVRRFCAPIAFIGTGQTCSCEAIILQFRIIKNSLKLRFTLRNEYWEAKLVSLHKLSKQLMWFSTQECNTDRVFKDSRNFVMYKKTWCKKPRFIFIQLSKVIDSCWNKEKVLSKCCLSIYVLKILQITLQDLIRQVTGNKIGFFSQVSHDTRIYRKCHFLWQGNQVKV